MNRKVYAILALIGSAIGLAQGKLGNAINERLPVPTCGPYVPTCNPPSNPCGNLHVLCPANPSATTPLWPVPPPPTNGN